MEDIIHIPQEDEELDVPAEYSEYIGTFFVNISPVAVPIVQGAKQAFEHIEQTLYTSKSFLDMVKASVPKETLQAVLTNEQKEALANGTLKLMTKKDGSLMANLINPKNKKIASSISLEKISTSPEMSDAMTNYVTQMQLAQLAEQIQMVQTAIEDVRQGQESDRLATAYSCQQKLLQTMKMRDPELKKLALLHLVSDAEDSRNLLMQSQTANLTFIENQPESYWGKLLSNTSAKKIDSRMEEIRESLCAMNMVSLAEAIAYRELGEPEACELSLSYYGDYIKSAYLDKENLVERLDMVDPSPEQYWSKTLPNIQETICALPSYRKPTLLGGDTDGTETMQEMQTTIA